MAEDDNNGEEEAGWIKELRKKANANAQLEAKLAQYEAKETVRSAGLNLNDRQLKALLATHEGESTPEALKATAVDLGFYTPEPEVDPDVQQGHEAVQNASNGAQRAPEVSAEDEYATANSPEEVMAIANKRGTAIAYD